MLCSDVEGLLVVEACREAGLTVGRNVGLIGVGNDSTLCQLTNPPLSSVDVDIQTVGYKAAETLDSMIRGKPAPDSPIRVEPLFVECRASTEFPAFDDPALGRAIGYIRTHCAQPIRPDLSVINDAEKPRKNRRRIGDMINGIHRMIPTDTAWFFAAVALDAAETTRSNRHAAP